jgi:hypothetical protein
VEYQCIYNANRLREDIIQIDYVKISCKEDVHICGTNFAKKKERNSHERTGRWKMYGKRLFFEDLEVRDVKVDDGDKCFPTLSTWEFCTIEHPSRTSRSSKTITSRNEDLGHQATVPSVLAL